MTEYGPNLFNHIAQAYQDKYVKNPANQVAADCAAIIRETKENVLTALATPSEEVGGCSSSEWLDQ